ncbi:MAG: TlyA family RNA methyltransferase [Clostridia bacterium]|nr:TlyA family RNA methyltransferase [Clostridia bacterium]
MRADEFLTVNGFYPSRNKAQEALKSGKVLIDGKKVKPSASVTEGASVSVLEEQFVSNGGAKLQAAFDYFHPDVLGKVCFDAGASTGGFTEVLLSHGARRVYAADVGEGLLHPSLVQDERVVVMDRCNVRLLTVDSIEKIDFLSGDLSFISLKLVLGVYAQLLHENGEAIVLVKPQFEVGKQNINKNGIVTDSKARLCALQEVALYAKSVGFCICDVAAAPRRDSGMNVEYLLYLKKICENELSVTDFSKRIEWYENRNLHK